MDTHYCGSQNCVDKREKKGSHLEQKLICDEEQGNYGWFCSDEEAGIDSRHDKEWRALAGEGTTFFRSCLNGLNTICGIGILSISYALSEAGWAGLALLFLVAIVCCYTGILLQRCMDTDTNIQTYPDIADRAFGYYGQVILSVFFYLELYLVAIEFLILEGDNLAKLFPSLSFEVAGWTIERTQGFIILSALIILPTAFLRSLDLLAYVSASGILASLVVIASVTSSGLVDGVGFHSKGRALNPSGIPSAISLFAFCYCGHAVFPTICSSMKDRTKFSKVLILSFTISTLIYGSMGILGYLMYGEEVKSQVTLNLPNGKLSSKIAIYTTLINPFTKYALVVTPIASAIEDALPSTKSSRSTNIFMRTLLMASTVTVALTIPLFGDLMTLIGSFLSCTVSLIFPCICYLKLFGISRIYKLELMFICGILGVGSSIAILGSYYSLRQIAENL
ncbi:hypothetical protein AMTRI_Chr04g189810 [Amborella trichopoda]|uniref:vacuolar amino acid transporter 1-like n=1 Tax=Amborella trichopoda TaxID=13333 RepID=UPI0005D3CF09|nr:vacuolar amino acid transporter 1-like [Amborella trichopoda]|eukprot:XP_011621943.1 vacuolar amino acid transporter 1-like [Amborella trichopoda]